MDEKCLNHIRSLCDDLNNIVTTPHAAKRFRERKILLKTIIEAIRNGEIIEHYPNDYPFPSFLVHGITSKNINLHTVCAVGDNKLWIITSYFPSSDEWEDDCKTRKAVK